jgi:hypothetical protein
MISAMSSIFGIVAMLGKRFQEILSAYLMQTFLTQLGDAPHSGIRIQQLYHEKKAKVSTK